MSDGARIGVGLAASLWNGDRVCEVPDAIARASPSGVREQVASRKVER